MKKIISTMLIAVIAVLMLGTVSKATTKNELKDYVLTEKGIGGTNYVIRDSDKKKVENFFAKNEITDAQATEIKGLIDKAIKLMNEDGAKDPNAVSKAKKQELASYVQQAASILGLTVSYDATEKRLDIYRDGKLLDSLFWGVEKVKTSTGTTKYVIGTKKAAQTGSTNYVYAIAGAVVLIAGTTLLVAKRKTADVA